MCTAHMYTVLYIFDDDACLCSYMCFPLYFILPEDGVPKPKHTRECVL